MTYGKDTVGLRDRFDKFNLDKAELKKDFEEYITAPQFSLDLRWQMFLDAPEELTNIWDHVYHGLDLVNDGKPGGETWIRYGCWENGDEFYLPDHINDFLALKRMSEWPCMKDPDIITKVKEQVLKDNIRSFRYG